jgi:transposase
MGVFIGVDPHKRLHAVVVVDDQGEVHVRAELLNTKDGFDELVRLGRRWKQRTWAVEGCNGVGKHLAQRLFAAGERVVDVSTRRAALVRVYAGGNGRKNDDTDAHSIAMVALHTPDLPEVRADGRAVALRLVSHRRKELIGLRTQAVCRIHRDLQVLIPGGAARKLSAARARELLSSVRPRDEVGKLRRRLIADQIGDLERLDRQISKLDVELADLVDNTPTALRDLYGVGVITTALILGEVGNVARFKNKDHFASYNGTAPADRGSAGNPQPSVNCKGNRRINHAIHVVAVTQVRHHPPARELYARKISEGKTKKEALRVVKRRVSDAIYRQLVIDAQRHEAGPGGHAGTSLSSSVTSSTPTAGSSDRPQPGPKLEPTTIPEPLPA